MFSWQHKTLLFEESSFNTCPNLQSRLTKDGIWVQGEFDSVIITRSKKDGLSIKIGNEVFEGSSKLSEEKLDEILSELKALGTRFGFLEDDLTEIKSHIDLLDARISALQTAGVNNQQAADKSQRLAEFREASSRW